MRGWAGFSRDGVYRYSLGRRWATGGRRVCFCLLNPSTADARVLDPTLTRCLGYARGWGFACMDVVNIFALRSTDPAALKAAPDPIGRGNDAAIRRCAARGDLVVAGWGAHGVLHARHERVLGLLARHGPVHCLGTTAHGLPRHPLYLRKDLEPALLTAPSSTAGS